jgi:hypothetical protein
MWVRVAGPKHQRIILFDYDPSRGGEVADALVEGCKLSGLRDITESM